MFIEVLHSQCCYYIIYIIIRCFRSKVTHFKLLQNFFYEQAHPNPWKFHRPWRHPLLSSKEAPRLSHMPLQHLQLPLLNHSPVKWAVLGCITFDLKQRCHLVDKSVNIVSFILQHTTLCIFRVLQAHCTLITSTTTITLVQVLKIRKPFCIFMCISKRFVIFMSGITLTFILSVLCLAL